MIDKRMLRELVIESLGKKPNTQITSMQNDVESLFKERDLFPTKEECEAKDVDYKDYAIKQLNRIDRTTIAEIAWDLVMERVITPNDTQSTYNFPWISLTTFGKAYISEASPHYYDADGYITFLKNLAPNLDPVVAQYTHEGLNCYRRALLFASAVMFGAAAEKTILLLLEAISRATKDTDTKSKLEQMIEGARLPTIIKTITDTLETLTKDDTIPYAIHQGCNEHLASLFEMIRVQRNDAVHPAAGEVNRDKVFLTMQTLPTGIQCVYKLIEWFNSNEV